MNANPFKPIAINWGSLTPTTGDELSVEWCKKIAALEVRGAGFAGSVVVPLVKTSEFTLPLSEGAGIVRRYDAVASVALPDNAYGSNCPPMIYTSVQYGTRIYYKRHADPFGLLKRPNPGVPSVPSEFITYISNLHYDEITTGTFRWSFDIRHQFIRGSDFRTIGDSIFEAQAPLDFRSPWLRMRVAPWPSADVLAENEGKNKVALYYYALGMEPNLV